MEKFLMGILSICLLFNSCGGEEEQTEEVSEDHPEIDLPFEEGGAKTPNAYFDGVVLQVKAVDNKLRHVFDLDEMNASTDSITSELDSMKTMIAEAKGVLKLYEDKDWPKRDEFQNLTLDWYNGMEHLVMDYLYTMAEPMSRPDKTWTTEEQDFYDEYAEAYYEFYEVDQAWVEFQAEFAEANNFKLKEEEAEL